MKAWIVLALAAAVGPAACQSQEPVPGGATHVSAAAAQEVLLTLVPDPELTGAQQSLLSTIRARPSSAEVHVARLADAPDSLLRQGKAVAFSLAPGKRVVALGERVERREPGDLSWSGSIRGEPGAVQLVLSGRDVTATLRTAESVYHVEPLGGGLHAVTRVDQTRLPPDHPPDAPTGTPPTADPLP